MSSSQRTCPPTVTGWQSSTAAISNQRRRPGWSDRLAVPCQRALLALLVVLLSALARAAVAQAALLTVNVLTDNAGDSCPATCSLRAALAAANAGDEIQFSVTGTIVLSQGELVVDTDVTITGPGANSLALDGNLASRVLRVNSGVTATISGLTIQNGVSRGGGGILNEESATLAVTDSTLSGNSAFFNGGGIVNGFFGTVTLTNSTLSGNIAGPGGNSAFFGGGGIFNAGTMTVTNSTLSGNIAGTGGGIYNFATLTLASSIVAHSLNGGNCDGNPLISQGDNLSSDATCVVTDPALNDRNNTDPLLDPDGLQDNGGPTLTLALQPTSPAVDGVLHNVCPRPATDQRGVRRPVGARCDIGAFEFEALSPVPGDLNDDGEVDQNDLSILLADRNTSVSASACGAPCDLDRDGQITALDARKLTLLCTRPRCATP